MIKTLIKILTLDCREATAFRSALQDGELNWGDRWALRAHMLVCRTCRRYRDQLHKLRRILQTAGILLEQGETLPGISLSKEARDRLRKVVE